MKAALRTRISGNTAAGSRVDWGLRPQAKDLPAIRLTHVSTPRDYQMSGAMVTQRHRVQIDCFGTTYKAASDLGDAVIALLEPVAEPFLGGFVRADFDRQDDLETGPIHCRVLDFEFFYVSA